GVPITLKANYFKLETDQNWYQYDVCFSPEVESAVEREGLLDNVKESIGVYVLDGTTMFSINDLGQNEMKLFSTWESDEIQTQISLQFVKKLVVGEACYIQFFNKLMRQEMRYLQLQLVGQNFCDESDKIVVSNHPVEVWPGYLTSVHQLKAGMLMNCLISTKVVRLDTVLDMLTKLKKDHSQRYEELFKQQIEGAVVLTKYDNQTYYVDYVNFDLTPTSTFEYLGGEQISYKDYYQSAYQKTISDDRQPLLVAHAGKGECVCLVPELCRMTGFDPETRANVAVMRELEERALLAPQDMIDRLNAFNKRLLEHQSVRRDLQAWNVRLDDKLIEFQGRVLPWDKILHGPHLGQVAEQSGWMTELGRKPMLVTPTLSTWTVIVPVTYKKDAQDFVTKLIDAAWRMRFDIRQPYFKYVSHQVPSFEEALEEVNLCLKPQMIMCIVPERGINHYTAIKKKCCLDRAVPTQVIVANNLTRKGVQSIATSVAIQMCCKIGGVPWTVEIPISGLMVVGFDVYHDTTPRGGNSYGAFVASLNKTFSQYFSAVSAHTPGQELSNDMASYLGDALCEYKKCNGALPEQIVIYRDGVFRHQIPEVKNREIVALKKCWKDTYGEQECRMAFIVVTKRIRTRLFHNNENPPPGTVADDCITTPEICDFFLVPRSVCQGTVRPTGYGVLFNKTGLDIVMLQKITYKMAHLYFNQRVSIA
ncbi:Protein piwi, partial [Zootermopsis nevadensis]